MNTVERRAWLGFVAVVAVVVLIGWLVYANAARLDRDNDALAHSNETLNELEATLSSLQDIESGQRGYLLAANPDFLRQYDDGIRDTAEHLARLKALAGGDAVQQERLASLESLSTEKIAFAREAVAIRDRLGDQAADQFVATGRGRTLMDEARAVVATMTQSENERLERQTSASDANTRNTAILTGSLAVLSLALFATLLVAIMRSLASQRRAADAAARLGAVVGASSDAIISLDLEGRIIDWNAGAERIFGYSVAEVRGQHISLIAPPDQLHVQESNLHALREGDQVVGQETVRIAKDGRRVDVSLSAFPLRDPSGGLTGFGGVFRDIAERKQAEAALRESQRRFSTIFSVSPAGTSIIRLSDGAFVDVNGRFLELFGFAREEVIGRTSLDLGMWPDASRRTALVERIASEGSVRDVEIQWRTSSGRIIDTITSWELVELGGEPCVLTLIGDITARKQAERDRERIFDLSSDLIAIADFNGVFRRVNPAIERLGYSEEEILDRPFFDLLHPDDRDAATARIARLAAGERSLTFEGRLRARDGSYHWVELAASADPDNAVLYSVARDITARKEMEEALRTGEERFRSVVETATDAIIITDRLGNIEVFNPAAEQTFGYAAAEVAGQNVKILIPSPQKEEHDGYIAAFLERGTSEILSLRREMVGQRKDGSVFPHELTVNPMELSGELKFTAIIRDIAERKQMEAELREAKEAAEEASRAKSAFLSRMSHELRTPLNVVLGFAQVLQLDPLDPPQAEAVDHILKAGRHLLELIDEVLDISRIEAGRLSLSIEPVRADELLADTLMLMRPLAAQRHVTLHADLDTCHDHVLADRQRIKQVLLNLLSNAIKYNREGGAVRITCDGVAGPALRITIADTGPGIAPGKLERLFNPFDRLGAEATPVEGTGLGLTLSKHLVEAMGGAIGVESTLDVGSTFWLELPRGEPPDQPPDHPGASPLAIPATPSGRRSVLYIEDNLSNLHLMERILIRQQGLHLLAAMQGSLGLELARDHHPDLILLDLHLPDMSGFDVLRELKTNPSTRDIPVVVITADATAGQRARVFEAGARDYLTKPLDLKEFLAVTDSILQARP